MIETRRGTFPSQKDTYPSLTLLQITEQGTYNADLLHVRLAERSKAAASGAVLLRKARVRTPQRTELLLNLLLNLFVPSKFLINSDFLFC